MTSTRLENLRRMQEKYEDGGHAQAAARVAARIKEVERQEAEDAPPVCDQCGKVPCQCDAMYDAYEDRMMFPDE